MITCCGSSSAASTNKHTLNREPTPTTKKRKKQINGRCTHNTNKRGVVMATAATGRSLYRCVRVFICVCVFVCAYSVCRGIRMSVKNLRIPQLPGYFVGCAVSQRFTRPTAAHNSVPSVFMAATRPVAAALSIGLCR